MQEVCISNVRILAERGSEWQFVKDLVDKREQLQRNYSFMTEKGFALTLAEVCKAVCRYDEDAEAYIFTYVGC